jgi:SNF2 family DNA or RNA helicase
VISLDIQKDTLIIIDSFLKLKPSQKSQLIFWGFAKSADNKSYRLLLQKNSEKEELLILKIIDFFDKEKVQFIESPAVKTLISDAKELLLKIEKIRASGKAFKDGDIDEATFKDFIKYIQDRVPRKLKSHQFKAAFHQYLVKNSANFSVPGSGKTSVVLSIYDILKSENKVNILFVIGPAACFGPWKSEFEKTLGRKPDFRVLAGGEKISRKSAYFSPPSKKSELYLTTYQSLVNDQEEVIRFINQKGIKVFLIVDEAHYIKQRGGIWASAVLRLSTYAEYRSILTGTPFPKSYTDVFNLFDFLWPNIKVLDPTTKTSIIIYEEKNNKDPVKKLLQDKIGPFFYRVRKSELGLIPPKFHSPFLLEMNKYEKRVYKAIEEKIKSYTKQDYLKNIDLVMKLRKGRIIRLRQCCSYVKLLSTAIADYKEIIYEDESDLSQVICNYDSLEIPAKLERLLKLVGELQAKKQKVIIWAYFVMTLKLIVTSLNKKGFNSKLIYGETPIENESIKEEETREKIRNEFVDPNSGLDVLVANPAACAESISLHKTCYHSIYYDLSYNCAQYLQSLDRIHRVGGSEKHQANYYFLQYENTIEQDIKANLDGKAKKMYDIIEQDYNIYTLDMFEEDEENEAYLRLFSK